jgi:protocatechuate 3,4-dioxygenase beta subunit
MPPPGAVTLPGGVTSSIRMLRIVLAAWILAAAAGVSQTVAQTVAQTVEGHVVNSATGAGIPGVAVGLHQAGKGAYSATTDSQGRFRIEAVKDGAYTAHYRAHGFWPVPNILDSGGQPAFQVTTGGEPVHLEAQMQPIPRISGRVLDDSGKPVPNATLWLLWESRGCNVPWCFPFSHQSKTGGKGEYTMGDPDVPGTWLLSATAPSSWSPPEPRDDQPLGWAQTFYPGVTDPQLAARVMVLPGGELGSLDIKLAAVPVHRIRGVVLDVRGEPVPKVSVELGKGFGPSLDQDTRLDQDTKDDGTFEFAPVADDEWRLSTTWEKDGVKLWTAQSVRIKGHDLEHIELRLTPPFSIHGKTVMEVPEGVPAPKPKPPEVMVAFDAGAAQVAPMNRIFTGNPDGRGDFTIQNLYPGPYQILPGLPPAPYYLDSIRLGEHDALGSDVPILSDAQPLTVTYKLGGGTVRGTIEACGAGHVFLIPQDPALRRGYFIRRTTCGQNGQFEFSAVRPGEYYGLAIAGDSPTPWYEAMWDEGMLRQAGRVTVRANESTSPGIRLTTR